MSRILPNFVVTTSNRLGSARHLTFVTSIQTTAVSRVQQYSRSFVATLPSNQGFCRFLSTKTTSNVATSSEAGARSGRETFKQIPVHPSTLQYIQNLGVGKPTRSKRRRGRPGSSKQDYQVLSASEEQQAMQRRRRLSNQSSPPPLPFTSNTRSQYPPPSHSSKHERPRSDQHRQNSAVQRLPVKLLASVGSLQDEFPKATPNLPEVAIAGRSNVGKSTLLNALLYGSPPRSLSDSSRKRPTAWTAKLPKGIKAATSARPGETRTLDFYQLSAKTPEQKVSLVLVDLPGFGFAHASEEQSLEWQGLMQKYIVGRGKALKRLLLLVDARHGLKKADVDFLESLQKALVDQHQPAENDKKENHRLAHKKKKLELVPIQLVLTKCDLVSQPDLARRVTQVRKELSDTLQRQPSALPVLLVSAQMEGQAGVLELQKELASLVVVSNPRSTKSTTMSTASAARSGRTGSPRKART